MTTRSPLPIRALTMGITMMLAAAATAGGIPDNLPDFSRAGYHAGEKPLPNRKHTLQATDFGVTPDDDTDDTVALQAAVAKACETGGVLALPPGRIILTDVLSIRSDNVVIRGAGAGKTTLYCPKPLAEIRKPDRNWSWSGGMIEVDPPPGKRGSVARVTALAPAGATRLAVEFTDAPRPEPGQWLEIEWFNDTGKDTLLDHLYGGVIPRSKMGREMQEATGPRVRDRVLVRAVADDAIAIAQPLPLDARPQWRVRLLRGPAVREVGIEGLTIAFPKTPYPGHLKERGYNGIHLTGALDCWVRDVAFSNADSGVFLGGCKRVTVSDVDIRGRTMHHPLCVSWSADCLVTRWRIDAPHIHGTTMSWSTHGTVYSHGWGRDLAMDSHRACSFENLHSDITIAAGGRLQSPFRSGGSRPRGPHAARRNVYWNVRVEFNTDEGGAKVTGHDEWPLGVFAYWTSNRKMTFGPTPGMEQRVIGLGEKPPVEDLHEYQLKKRLGK